MCGCQNFLLKWTNFQSWHSMFAPFETKSSASFKFPLRQASWRGELWRRNERKTRIKTEDMNIPFLLTLAFVSGAFSSQYFLFRNSMQLFLFYLSACILRILFALFFKTSTEEKPLGLHRTLFNRMDRNSFHGSYSDPKMILSWIRDQKFYKREEDPFATCTRKRAEGNDGMRPIRTNEQKNGRERVKHQQDK